MVQTYGHSIARFWLARCALAKKKKKKKKGGEKFKKKKKKRIFEKEGKKNFGSLFQMTF